MPSIDTGTLIYAIVILIWAGSWLATQVTAHRRKAAQKAKQNPKAERDVFAEELNRSAPRESPVKRSRGVMKEAVPELKAPPESAPLQARVGASPMSVSQPSTPPDFGKLFRDPKAFLAEMQRYAEASQDDSAQRVTPKAPGSAEQRLPEIRSAARRPVATPPASSGARRMPVSRPTPSNVQRKAERAKTSVGGSPKSQGAAGVRPEVVPIVRGQSSVAVQLGLLGTDDLRRAILLSEIIQPPVALRSNHLGGRSS